MKVFLTLLSAAGMTLSIPAQASNLQSVVQTLDSQRQAYALPVDLDQVLVTSALQQISAMQVVAFVLEDPSMAAPKPALLEEAQLVTDPTPVAMKGPPSPGRLEPKGETHLDELSTGASVYRTVEEMWHLIEHRTFADHHKAH